MDGLPEPSVAWMKDGHTIGIGDNGRIKLQGHELIIGQSTASDSGYYQCVARNEAGRHVFNIHLYVEPSENAPVAPTGLQVRSISSRKVSLTWNRSPPVNGVSTFAYSVHYFPSAGGSLPSSSSEFCADSLK